MQTDIKTDDVPEGEAPAVLNKSGNLTKTEFF